MKPASGLRRVAAGLVPAALLAALVLGGAELFLRARGWRDRPPPPAFEALARERLARVDVYRYDPRRFYTLAPDHRLTPTHAGRYATGPWPYRGRPAEPAPPDLARVAVVGDSTIYGVGVEVSFSLPERVQAHLAERGLTPDRCQVLNFGVQGYTTVQVRLCLEEVLAELAPDAVVIGAGGWNDQGPSLGIDDVEMLLAPRAPWERLLPALANYVEREGRAPIVLPEVSSERINEAWERGEPLFGTKVPEAHVPLEVERMVGLCRGAGIPALVLVPSHPASTAEAFPRTLRDRAAVRRAATEAGATVVDGPAILAASGLSDERLFLDFGHLTPEGSELLGRAIAAALAPLLPRRGAGPARDVAIRTWEPREASILGDVRVTVELEGWPDEGALPCIVVGGAPLLDVARVGAGRFEGLLMANGEGPQDLVVQGPTACVVAPDALRLVRPWLEPRRTADAARPVVVRVHARPGDRAQVFWAEAKRSEPLWWEAGPIWLGGTPRPPVEGGPSGPDGTLELELPAEAGALETLFLQARVTPGGEPTWERAGVASTPAVLHGL